MVDRNAELPRNPLIEVTLVRDDARRGNLTAQRILRGVSVFPPQLSRESLRRRARLWENRVQERLIHDVTEGLE